MSRYPWSNSARYLRLQFWWKQQILLQQKWKRNQTRKEKRYQVLLAFLMIKNNHFSWNFTYLSDYLFITWLKSISGILLKVHRWMHTGKVRGGERRYENTSRTPPRWIFNYEPRYIRVRIVRFRYFLLELFFYIDFLQI